MTNFVEQTYRDGAVNLAAYEPFTQVHGPGDRFAIWTQGCEQRCEGCANPEMLSLKEKELIVPEKLIYLVRSQVESAFPVEGITLMGGEPVLQAKGLETVVAEVKEMGLNVLLFTGYTIEQLREVNSAAVNKLLDLVDTVIDGSFCLDKLDVELIRGSVNQRIIHFSDSLKGRDFSRKSPEHFVNAHGGKVEIITTGFNF